MASRPMEKHSPLESMDESNHGEIVHDSNSIPHYSEQEAEVLEEKLMNEKTFKDSLQVLIAWLEEGICNEKNAEHFYSLIEICWNRVEKLQIELEECLQEFAMAQEDKNLCIHLQLNEIEGIFIVLEKEYIRSNFSQNQIEKIQEMKTDLLDFKQRIGKDSVPVEEKKSSGMENVNNEVQTEKQESENLKKSCEEECLKEILKLKAELEKSKKRVENNSFSDNCQKSSDAASQCELDQDEMRIISLISVCLYDKPDGVNIDYIYSHLNNYIPATCAGEIENLMRRYPNIFKESSSIGATQENKWMCISIDQKTITEFLNE